MKKENNIGIGIVGAGLIGEKRAAAVKNTKQGNLVAVADLNFGRAKILASKFGAEALADWKNLVLRKDIDVVIVAVPNAFAAPIVLSALENRKHVLCEKPFGINAKESVAMIRAAEKRKKIIQVGFNHRFHPAIMKAYDIFMKGGIGKILFIRARYGHGGRKGMEKEWRFNKAVSGGGELLDQGVHIIDLARWFGGDFDRAYGLAETKFWKTKIDDNAFALLRNKGVTVSFHVSTTNWKNIFSFEIFGESGYLQIEGKGGNYGKETLIYGKRKPGSVPDIAISKFGAKDTSWMREWENFMGAINGRERVVGAAIDGLRANQIVEAIYESSKKHKEVNLTHKRMKNIIEQ